MKRRVFKNLLLSASFVACLGLGCLGGRILAYYSDSDNATNTISIGSVTTTESEHVETDNPFDVTKEVYFTNTGVEKCFIRARLTWSNDSMKNYAQTAINTEDWEYVADEDYYYYKGVLNPGETTPALLKKITFGKDIPYELQKDYDVHVYHESIHQGSLDASQYKDAWKIYLEGRG